VRVILLTGVLVYLWSILAVRSAPVIRSLVPFFFIIKKIFIWHEIRQLDELVVGPLGPSDARAVCDGICRHFAYESYLLKVSRKVW
jgi:hypothetical protein